MEVGTKVGPVRERPNVEAFGGATPGWEYTDAGADTIARIATAWLAKIKVELLESTGRTATVGRGSNRDASLTLAERHALRTLYELLCTYVLARHRLSKVKIGDEVPEADTSDAALRYMKHATISMEKIEKLLARLGLSDEKDLAKYRTDVWDRPFAAEDADA